MALETFSAVSHGDKIKEKTFSKNVPLKDLLYTCIPGDKERSGEDARVPLLILTDRTGPRFIASVSCANNPQRKPYLILRSASDSFSRASTFSGRVLLIPLNYFCLLTDKGV